MKAKANILKTMKAVYVKAEDSELKPKLFKDIRQELKFLSEQLKLTRKQALLFSIIFCECIDRNGSVSISQIATYINSDSIDFLDNLKELARLIDKGYLNKDADRYSKNDVDENYKVNANIREAIILQKEISTANDLQITKAIDFVDYVFTQMKQVSNHELTFTEVEASVSKIIRKYKQMPFVAALIKDKLVVADLCILLYYMGQYRMGDRSVCIKSLVTAMYGETSKSADLIQNMAAEEHILRKAEFLKEVILRHSREFEFELTGKSKQLMRIHQILPNFKTKICADTFDLLYSVDVLFEKKNDDLISARELVEMVENLLKTNEDLKIVEELKKLRLKNREHQAIYLQVLYEGGMSGATNIEFVTSSVYESNRDIALIKNEFFQETHELIEKELLELSQASFFSSGRLQITERSQDLLIDCGWKMPRKSNSNYSILPEDIKSKPLFYNDADATQMTMLRGILDEEIFAGIQKRMSEKAMPTGVIALLYGHPGTGKTESVYQFAKQTNREVIQVDISQSKSMWFGESEKQIKKIFTKYEQYANRCKIKPILLFNEADAIISKRKDASSSNVAQTENAIQNILLEEFEKFTGICIATTNLVSNLDSAFERRFLYKIELTKPTTSTLSKIWESKLSNASHYDTHALATQYPFSGGQIDNIVKKIEMHEILHGSLPDQSEVTAWCDSEGFQHRNQLPIGYMK